MIPGFLIPGFYLCINGIFRDILGFFSLMQIEILYIKLFAGSNNLNSENLIKVWILYEVISLRMNL
jgi:hypothetical protein